MITEDKFTGMFKQFSKIFEEHHLNTIEVIEYLTVLKAFILKDIVKSKMFSEHVKAEEDMYEQYLKLENKRLKHD
jgi:hypothetical protein